MVSDRAHGLRAALNSALPGLRMVGRFVEQQLRTKAVLVRVLMTVAMVAISGSIAHAERRVALVIGVSRYEHVPALKNSLNDEADMAAALRDIGFDVTEIRDPDQKAMSDGIAAFSRKLPGTDIAAFYYSGHAIQVGERNFLIPRDADLELPSDVALRTLDLNAVIAGMESSARVRIILLDACRDNPFQGLAGMRSIGTRGLQPVQSGVGTFVAFATAPGSVAADGDGRNSPFARALLKYIRMPGLEVNQILRNVRADVYAATAGRQVPWDHSSLIGELVLVPQGGPAEPKVASLAVPAPVVTPAAPPSPAPTPPGPAAVAPSVKPVEQPANTDKRSAAIASPSAEPQPMATDDAYALYDKKPGAKAFAVSANGYYGMASATPNANKAALVALYWCNRRSGSICRLKRVQNGSTLAAYDRFDRLSATALTKLAEAEPRGDPASEGIDNHVRTVSSLHPEPYHGLTPLTAPGAERVTTAELVKMINGADKPILIDVTQWNAEHDTLPGAYWFQGAGVVTPKAEDMAKMSDLLSRLLGSLLADRERPVVFFCTGRDCWLSHNATMRAVASGYKRVYWYRGGVDAWRAARLPLVRSVQHAQIN